MFKMDIAGVLPRIMFVVMALFTAVADASLMQKIETTPFNPKLYTIVDTANHQQWLDGWSTAFISYNQAKSYFLPDGYHVATTKDLFNLFGAAGLADELGYDQWGKLKGDYIGSQRAVLESFSNLMGFFNSAASYFTYDNGDLNTYPIIKINAYDPYSSNYGQILTIYDMPNANKDFRIGMGWGVSTLMVKNLTSMPEPTGLVLAFIGVLGLAVQRRFKVRV